MAKKRKLQHDTEVRHKRRHQDTGSSKAQIRTKNAVNPLKERIRDIKRVLGHSDSMPADRQVELERELHTLEQELRTARSANQKRDMIGRYHMVRFFEKQKASRRLRQARKKLEAATSADDTAAARHEFHMAEVDLNYTTHFPLNLPYVSLYPSKKEKNEDGQQDDASIAVGPRGDVDMWRMVEECTANSTLDSLRDGHLTEDRGGAGLDPNDGPSNKSNQKRIQQKSKVTSGTKKDAVQNETVEDDDSDGGFFE
ncbi:MAG: 18S rRNA maturation protein [Bathelium mastoideum]|nr:MAG: 18S rRNA maturation protein [Bathelium mastoideum]KAI9692183.1 MAG: 18S rRNA maturation protein [Bathelium mastoideum]